MRRPLCSLVALIAVGAARSAFAVVYEGVDFPSGSASFADAVINFSPNYGGGPAPTDFKYVDPSRALGEPNYVPDAGGSGGDFNGTGAVSLGHGGRLDLLFTDNLVTNDGGAGADLGIFERGVDEQFHVAVRPANDTTAAALGALCKDTAGAGDVAPGDGYCYVGLVGPSGGSDVVQVNLDAAFAPGVFGPGALRFDAVQLIDTEAQGAGSGDQVGPDIDAVGGIGSEAIVCGDGLVEGSEDCDDANAVAGDGCTTCIRGTCWECPGEPSVCAPDDGVPAPGACEDGQFCTANDVCSGLTCVSGAARDCEEGNTCTTDSCNESADVCVHAPNTLPCDDGSNCSINDTCVATECVGQAVEATGCRTSLGPTQLRVINRDDDELDSVIWRWSKGESTTLGDIGNPLGGTGRYEFCVFDGPTGNRRVRAVASAEKSQDCGGTPCWRLKGTSGYLFKDLQSTLGMRQLLFKTGTDGKAKVLVKGRGDLLNLSEDITMLLPPAGSAVRAQLRDVGSGECWEAAFPSATRNDEKRFKATAVTAP